MPVNEFVKAIHYCDHWINIHTRNEERKIFIEKAIAIRAGNLYSRTYPEREPKKDTNFLKFGLDFNRDINHLPESNEFKWGVSYLKKGVSDFPLDWRKGATIIVL